MSVGVREIESGDAGQRLDRWFRRHYPDLGQGRLQRLLRAGQVRIDGKRVKASHRIEAGEKVRIPPEASREEAKPQAVPRVSAAERRRVRELVLHADDEIFVIDKPAGLAVQGGSGVNRHLDAMLDGLREAGGERPRLVHRLDKDTSGLLLLARDARSAARLTKAFRDGEIEKTYWAIVAGLPPHARGRIDLPLAKRAGPGGERARVDDEGGLRAITDYAVIDRAGRHAAWLAMRPLTGRTHQLRAHAAAMGTPILGDGKYGRRDAFPGGLEVARRLHLHARSLVVPDGRGGWKRFEAPPPVHFRETLAALGFDLAAAARDPLEV